MTWYVPGPGLAEGPRTPLPWAPEGKYKCKACHRTFNSPKRRDRREHCPRCNATNFSKNK
ncbi:MAG: hypothetical protein ACOYYS_19385 [Chloroflexota bacterium]